MTAVIPFFTVAIPVYNGKSFIQKAIDSVLAQSFKDWELVVIDNQSTDGTWELVEASYSNNPKIRLLRNATNVGLNANMARCVSEAKGEWIAILAADDSYVSHTLETANKEMCLRPNLVLWIHSQLVYALPRVGIEVAHNDMTLFSASDMAEIFYKTGGKFGPISNQIFKRSCAVLHDINFTDGTQTVDVRFWTRLLKANPTHSVIYWPDALAHVLHHESSASSVYWRQGYVIVDLFECIQVLSILGWSRAVLIYQMARVMKCWVKFFRKLPREFRLYPLEVLRSLALQLLRND